jgi:hypothetical protein
LSEKSSDNVFKRTGRIAGWAVYLAMSWTWCIGMFMPVLIMRELGFSGVLTFGIPNILGAIVMGWLIRSQQKSREIVDSNRTAAVWFSLITIVYQAFFAAWMIRIIDGPAARFQAVVVFVVFWLILKWKRGGEFLASFLALAISAAVMAWAFTRGELPFVAHPVQGTRLPAIDNLWLAPAWIFGFACSPWLDLTFHRARQSMNRADARAAFTLGFGVLFSMVLLLTVAYSGWLVIGLDRLKYPELAMILSIYWIVQSCLTCALHVQQLARVERRMPMRQFFAFSALLVAAVALGIFDRSDLQYHGIPLGEMVYRMFMGFYGLIVPAYVWLRMIGPRRSMLRVWTVIAVAAPLYWLGFAAEMFAFIVPGIAVVVLAKFLPEGRRRVS